jgi:hypothetical protein
MEDIMQDSTFEIDQINKLREIERARMKRGEPGLRTEIQALIMRLQSGGVGTKSDDPRITQAKRLWDKGFGEKLDSFLASIPEIPETLKPHDERFPLLVLVVARLGITKSCRLAGLKYNGATPPFEDFDPKKARTAQVYWMRCQDGRRNRGKSVKACRDSFAKDELGLTTMEGVALYVQNPEVIREHYLDLPSSVSDVGPGGSACLGYWGGEPELYWARRDDEISYYGSASRRE